MSIYQLSFSIIFLFSQFVLAEVIYVDHEANGLNQGSSWEDAYLDLQVALSNAKTGDQIWVSEGIYFPGTSRESSYELKKGITIYGGFKGIEINLDERVPSQHNTVLSGDVGIPGDNSDNCYHVFFHSSDSNIDSSFGGGMSNDLASPKLINCIFQNNSAISGVGGGLSNYTYSNVELINCIVFGNSAGDVGGGMWNGGSSPIVTNSIFWGNTSDQIYGGGFPNPIISNSDIEGGYDGVGNLNTDPLFMDPHNGDFHLMTNSPLIDAGNPDALWLCFKAGLRFSSKRYWSIRWSRCCRNR
jgi:hypothetical protein